MLCWTQGKISEAVPRERSFLLKENISFRRMVLMGSGKAMPDIEQVGQLMDIVKGFLTFLAPVTTVAILVNLKWQ
ncbi:hypothetical protein [Aneurinibacillus migulanus]|uniref:hypothetical protein n=1 Tax=Aneurinibacillus migulanus TaxID=47500 RepID=UPI00209FACA4|nr:hypothetical protein [Aneurinibacillus migulanus]MCP1355452.1 hypothetical protein [Aneurinibacillus migulanus]